MGQEKVNGCSAIHRPGNHHGLVTTADSPFETWSFIHALSEAVGISARTGSLKLVISELSRNSS
jgi:hypothetical protein